jgi:hypothetical protein
MLRLYLRRLPCLKVKIDSSPLSTIVRVEDIVDGE